MNGGTDKIEIFKPFGEAFELTKKILFQPFDIKKWFVMGFAAFLCGHFSGGGFNFPFGNWNSRQTNRHFAAPDLGDWKPLLPVIIAVCVVVFLALMVVIGWLKARGNFIFTDCIVRNRGAIAEPWHEYRKEGNSYFLYLLVLMVGSLIFVGLLCLFGFVAFGFFGRGESSTAVTPAFILVLVLFFILWLCLGFFFGVISYFMIPVMYVRRCRAMEAFPQVARLVLDNGGSFVLFCLFSFCLLLGTGMIGGMAMCVTCCLAALPYIGTVILLPVFVCLRAFALRYIRQFGPDYDVWAGIPESTPVTAPEPPPLPS